MKNQSSHSLCTACLCICTKAATNIFFLLINLLIIFFLWVFRDESLPVPLPGQFGSSSDSFVPHDGEVCRARKILSDGNCCVQVEDNMPPSACGHKASQNYCVLDMTGHYISMLICRACLSNLNTFLVQSKMYGRVQPGTQWVMRKNWCVIGKKFLDMAENEVKAGG